MSARRFQTFALARGVVGGREAAWSGGALLAAWSSGSSVRRNLSADSCCFPSVRENRDADFTAYASGRWASLVRAAVLLGCSHQDAEDLAQTALFKTWSHWNRVSQTAEPDAYVYRLMVNALSTNRRRKWHGEKPTEDVPDRQINDHTANVALRDAVTTALRNLPREQQQVLVLRYVADLTERATADVLGVAVGTVKSRTSRALAALNAADFTDLAGDDS